MEEEGKERVFRREDSVARTEEEAFSYSASSRIRVRIVGTSVRVCWSLVELGDLGREHTGFGGETDGCRRRSRLRSWGGHNGRALLLLCRLTILLIPRVP